MPCVYARLNKRNDHDGVTNSSDPFPGATFLAIDGVRRGGDCEISGESRNSKCHGGVKMRVAILRGSAVEKIPRIKAEFIGDRALKGGSLFDVTMKKKQ